MFILEFSIDHWQGDRVEFTQQPARDWAEIAAAIQSLDAQYRTNVSLSAAGETQMTIGGGAGKYIAYVTFGGDRFFDLIDPTKPDGEERLIAGGQAGIFPARACVNLEQVLKAAKTFAEQGTLERSLSWAQDGAIVPV